MSAQHLMLLIFLAFALVQVVLAVPLAFGLVPPNRFYGFRTPKTLASREVWDAVNRFAGRQLLLAGVVQLAAVVWAATRAEQLSELVLALVLMGTLMLSVIYALARCIHYLLSRDANE